MSTVCKWQTQSEITALGTGTRKTGGKERRFIISTINNPHFRCKSVAQCAETNGDGALGWRQSLSAAPSSQSHLRIHASPNSPNDRLSIRLQYY
jgi:hypothetical protein